MPFADPTSLRHTLILPTDANGGAGPLLEGAIEDLDLVLMLVMGDDETAIKVVRWADRLCNKTQFDGGNLRRVVWVRNPAPVKPILDRLQVPGAARVAVLNFHDRLKATLSDGGPLDPLALEDAFLSGSEA